MNATDLNVRTIDYRGLERDQLDEINHEFHLLNQNLNWISDDEFYYWLEEINDLQYSVGDL